MSINNVSLIRATGVPGPRQAPGAETDGASPLDRDALVMRGPRDPYREYLLSSAEHQGLLDATNTGCVELLDPDRSGRIPMWVFPGHPDAVEVCALLARLRGHGLTTAEREWAGNDPLAPLPERDLLDDIDMLVRSIVVAMRDASDAQPSAS